MRHVFCLVIIRYTFHNSNLCILFQLLYSIFCQYVYTNLHDGLSLSSGIDNNIKQACMGVLLLLK